MLYSLDGVKRMTDLSLYKDVPVSWDETRIPQGDIEQHIASARRKGYGWQMGAPSNEETRNLKILLCPYKVFLAGLLYMSFYLDHSQRVKLS